MAYNVFSGTLNPTQSITYKPPTARVPKLGVKLLISVFFRENLLACSYVVP